MCSFYHFNLIMTEERSKCRCSKILPLAFILKHLLKLTYLMFIYFFYFFFQNNFIGLVGQWERKHFWDNSHFCTCTMLCRLVQ